MTDTRMQRLLTALDPKGVDVYLATHTSDIRWLTGYAGVFDDEQAHLALIGEGLAPTLFTDTRYSGALNRLDEGGYWRILDERKPRAAYVAETLKALRNSRPGNGLFRIGIESDLRLDTFRALVKALDEQDGPPYELVELPGFVTGLRSVKDAQEIELLKAAQAITDAAYTHMLDTVKAGLTEREMAVELEFFMRRAGADAVAFSSIVATGPNSAIPHAVPGDRVLGCGDFLLMDFGARLNDYRSDMTRTVVLGEPSEQQRAMYEAALAAQTAAIAMLRPGVKGLEAQAVAEAEVAAHGFEGKLIHSLGHGVGIDIHELPSLAPKEETVLKEGHVVTVEPGVYLEGVGGVRIEDFGVITADGFDDFTCSPHELIIL
jgi:Xaa-Pro aminopeptidase